MPAKKKAQSSATIPLKLTSGERKLFLDEVLARYLDCARIIGSTPASKPVELTAEQLEALGRLVAFQASHCGDPKQQKKLAALAQKAQHLLAPTDDEPQPATSKPTRRKSTRPQQAQDVVYQFKISLLGLRPLIWRRIQVQNGTLDKLHEHIQAAMGWTNSHLYQFDIRGRIYADPDLMEEDFDEFDCIDSTTTMLSAILPATNRRFAFRYQYDFGDDWEHEILFEGRRPMEQGQTYPLCLEGEKACPPEDIGGVWGYAHFLEAKDDPKHERHEEFKEWLETFDPDTFDAQQATTAMIEGLPDWRSEL